VVGKVYKGYLSSISMYKLISVKRYKCNCERCNHNWFSDKLPIACARCKSRSWNVQKKEKKNGI